MKKRLLLINTGGTIGMKPTDRGYVPEPGYLQSQMEQIPELKDPQIPDYEIHEYEPVMDSSNITPQDWGRIAGDIFRQHDQFDGFVILHGTDTMAYTASALPLMLFGLDKNVVLTGSQLPLSMLRNDARENLITAMLLASDYRVPEVSLYFGDRLLRGCRSTKVSTSRFHAFDSPNYPPLGVVGTQIVIHNDRIRRPDPAEDRQLLSIAPAPIATFRLFPGFSVEMLRNALNPPTRALVLLSFGVGNGPAANRPFIDAIAEANDRGLIVVNCTQCPHGTVRQDDYATGKAIADAGAISGRDLTIEAALAKLMFLFTRDLPVEQIKRQMQISLVGELTEEAN